MDTANPGDPRTRDEAPATAHTGRVGRIPADTFSNRLVLARRLAGLTIREAAAQAGLNYGSWSNWENGMRPQDPVDTCHRIAEALDVDFNWLLLGGPLAGPRGMPAKRAGEDNRRFPAVHVRPTDTRTYGRPGVVPDRSTTVATQRRPVRISQARAA